jgi:hypothetical protein
LGWEALGAFLSGVAAVLSALVGHRIARRRCLEDCERRIREVREAIHEGYEMREQ